MISQVVPACVLIVCVVVAKVGCESPIALVIWHGMGDTCCDGLSYLTKWLKYEIPGIYVNINTQIEMACDELGQDPKLQGGFNAIGFSQGGQFLRALVQRCAKVKVYNLITLGSQHQGIYGVPFCMDHWMCDLLRKTLSLGAYLPFVQNSFVQAQFWHDPIHEDSYRLSSAFLSDINQEIEVNHVYKERLSNLSNFVMVKFLKDRMVQPSESEWFGFYMPGQAIKVYTLYESDMFQKDSLGLQYLSSNGRLHLVSFPTGHLQMSKEEFLHLMPFINVTRNNVQKPIKL